VGTALILILVILLILVVYFSALLIFTPYEEDDKYVLKMLRMGFRVHEKAEGNKIFKKIIEFFAQLIVTLAFFILKDRKLVEEKKKSPTFYE